MTATLHVTSEIIEFARRVREQLADLPAEDIDDLTDGLEADMAEACADSPGHELPDATAYALELRNAAGLPIREASAKGAVRHARAGVATGIRVMRESFVAGIRQNHFGSGVLDFMIELRPAWWLLRAWVAFQMIESFFGGVATVLPNDIQGSILLLVCTAVSVQWGRKQWLPFAWLAGVIVIGNVATVLLLVPSIAMAHATTSPYTYQAVYNEEPAQVRSGVQLNGKEVTNIFAYGADGKPVKNVQLFDQDGQPLATSTPGGNGCLENTPCVDGNGEAGQGVWIPSFLETGAKAWNVYPMQMQGATYDDATGQLAPDPTLKPENRTSPFIKVPAVLQPEKVVKGNG